MVAPTPRRRGPRADGDARAEIVTAARSLFATKGYDATSLRGIAREAGVDPALVHHYFPGGKPEVFMGTIVIDVSPAEIVERIVTGPHDEAGRRLLETFVSVWERPEASQSLVAMIKGVIAGGGDPQASPVQQFVLPEIIMRVCTELQVPQPARSGGLVASQMIGLIVSRYLLQIPPVVAMSREELVDVYGETIQRYLDLL